MAKLAKSHDVYILCATRGEGGTNSTPTESKNLAKIRSKELRKSAKIIGAKGVYFLGFIDGTLSNSLYHALAKKIEAKLKLFKPGTLITFEPRGISGHIDHITVSMVTTYLFYKLPFAKTLLYHCVSDQTTKLIKDYFIYFPPGYKKNQIDKVVDVSDVWETKKKAIMTHQSQIYDAKRILKQLKLMPKEEYFLVVEK